MSHTIAKRLHGEEEMLRTALEGALLRYGVLLGSMLVVLGIGLAIIWIER